MFYVRLPIIRCKWWLVRDIVNAASCMVNIFPMGSHFVLWAASSEHRGSLWSASHTAACMMASTIMHTRAKLTAQRQRCARCRKIRTKYVTPSSAKKERVTAFIYSLVELTHYRYNSCDNVTFITFALLVLLRAQSYKNKNTACSNRDFKCMS